MTFTYGEGASVYLAAFDDEDIFCESPRHLKIAVSISRIADRDRHSRSGRNLRNEGRFATLESTFGMYVRTYVLFLCRYGHRMLNCAPRRHRPRRLVILAVAAA